MSTHLLRTSIRLPKPIHDVFAFFADADNLGRITPPELRFHIRTPRPIAIGAGTIIDYTIGLYGLPLRWRTRITEWDPPHRFADDQVQGPYAEWHHTHSFRADGAGATVMDDEVRYRLPFGAAGDLAHPLVRLQLRRIFTYRQRTIWKLLELPGEAGSVEVSIR
jgi:ligand-binding SRPBCC domain-containing protein